MSVGLLNTTALLATNVTVDRSTVLHTFDESFASVTHDIQDFIGYNIAPWSFNWTDPTLHALLEALTPFVVRAGGTWEDGIAWADGPRPAEPPHLKPGMQAHMLTEAVWRPFARAMKTLKGAQLIVGLGALWRHWGGCSVSAATVCPNEIPWDSRNAAAFIRADREAGHAPLGYQLGNEPAVWNWTWGTPIVPPRQHAPDYAALRAVIGEVYNDIEPAQRPWVLGPDTTWGPIGDEQPGGGRGPVPGKGGPNYDYWNGTLQHKPDIDVATFHYYGLQPGLVTTWKDFVAAARDRTVCVAVAAHARDLASSPLAGRAALWLGEGGMTYGGFNRPDVQGGNWLRLYGGGLSYLENLCCAASNGAHVFMRQQLSNFITGTRPRGDARGPNAQRYTPQPAWWVAVLWKRLVGTRAFSVSVSTDSAGPVHAFAFDGKGSGGGSDAATTTVLVITNWDLRSQQVAVNGCVHDARLYVLAPAGSIHHGGTILADSTGIAINGREALVDAGGAIPHGALEPSALRCESGSMVLELPGLTGAFVTW